MRIEQDTYFHGQWIQVIDGWQDREPKFIVLRAKRRIAELKAKVERTTTPVVVAGDFNLIRSPEDKSSAIVDIPRMRMFNDCIADLALREITRIGARYTWTNKRVDLVRSVLDRAFVSVEWEVAFPLCTLRALTRIGSDHTPLLLSSGGGSPPRLNRFHFENFWLSQPGFVEAVQSKWLAAVAPPPSRVLCSGCLASLCQDDPSIHAWLGGQLWSGPSPAEGPYP
jgi:hypothetical protein